MSSLTRFAAAIAFAAAVLAQPLALDACSVSCEALRAARTPAVAPPCHHTTSCASQISQPTSPGSTPVLQALAPAIVAFVLPRPVSVVSVRPTRDVLACASPPTPAQLRV